jgi:outer membrane protease
MKMPNGTKTTEPAAAVGKSAVQRFVMRFIGWLGNTLTVEQFSVNHLFAAGFVYAALDSGHYIAAALIYIFGSIYCGLMVKLNNA